MVDKETMLDMSTTIRLNEELKKKLVRIGAAEALRDGEDRTMQDIIGMLVKFYEEHKEKSRK
jgi:predicted transcriptional regulator